MIDIMELREYLLQRCEECSLMAHTVTDECWEPLVPGTTDSDYAANRIQDYIDTTNECYAPFAAKYGIQESIIYPFAHPEYEPWDFEN